MWRKKLNCLLSIKAQLTYFRDYVLDLGLILMLLVLIIDLDLELEVWGLVLRAINPFASASAFGFHQYCCKNDNKLLCTRAGSRIYEMMRLRKSFVGVGSERPIRSQHQETNTHCGAGWALFLFDLHNV